MKFKLTNLMLMGALGLSVSAFTINKVKKTSPKTKSTAIPPKKFIDPANMDLSVKPGDNFFEFANGNWMKQNEIPAKETRWGSFNILHQENTDHLLVLLNEVSKKQGLTKGSLEQRVGDLYASGMDTV